MNGKKGNNYKEIIDNFLKFEVGKVVNFANTYIEKQSIKIQNDFFDLMNKVFLEGNDNLQNKLLANNSYAKKYYQEQIASFIYSSVFAKRAFYKPLGYAGDYLLMDMIYLQQPLPSSVSSNKYSNLLDIWFLNTPSAQACRNRHNYLVETIKYKIDNGVSRIASLACGPCREVITFLKNYDTDRSNIKFCFVDFDNEALRYAATHLNHKNIRFEFVNANLIKIALGQNIKELNGYDFVYAVGISDYMVDKLMIKFLHSAYRILNPGGTLMLGQFIHREDHPDRNGMQWTLDWNLIYRTTNNIRKLFEQTPFGSNITFHIEPLNIIAFVEATKII